MANLWPSLQAERVARARGCRLVAGVDEVGRGCLAGPVVAAAVILPLDAGSLLERLVAAGVRDSKLMSPAQREAAAMVIEAVALGIGIGVAPSWEVDSAGIVGATRRAMVRAVRSLAWAPDLVLVDALRLPELCLRQQPVIHGDRLCLSIAAASVVAKVRRDQWMVMLAERWPGYGLAANKGYPTAEHQQALACLGACPIHRRTFAPVAAIVRKA